MQQVESNVINDGSIVKSVTSYERDTLMPAVDVDMNL